MTASTSASAARTAYRVPGVYYQPRHRAVEPPAVRTDVAGFIGFEPRPSAGRPAPARCDDWRDYVLAFGDPPDDGTMLGPAVRAFFANGGRRCHVATVRRPAFDDGPGLRRALDDMVGVRGAGEADATGLERLLLIDEVSVVDAPDLHARRVAVTVEKVTLPGREEEARFVPCPRVRGPVGDVEVRGAAEALAPVFADDLLVRAQRGMVSRCAAEPWRALLLLSPPLVFGEGGEYRPLAPDEVGPLWRDRLADVDDTYNLSCAALYYPWLLAQQRVDAPVVALPPTPFVAGVIARRDLARGPQVAPANETLRGVVGLSWPLDDEANALLYRPDPDGRTPAVNVLRAFPGRGIQVWGSRTLSADRWLRYVPVRRSLSAIIRRVKASLDVLAFEPNTPLLWLAVTQAVLGVLQPLFDAGGLRGDRPEEAFYIRCDAAVNPPESVEAGRVVCEVGVAVAAPAEFVVFRVGRREGVVEVLE